MRAANELSWPKRLLFAAAAFVLFFGGLELALRALGAGKVDADPFVGFAATVPLYVERDGWMETNPSKALWFNQQRFEKKKPAGVVRIFTLGGSTTYGRPYDDVASFSGWLRELLGEVDPAKTYEVINAGGVSYASYRVAAVMEELLAYEPDIFVVYTGHNEFLERRTYSSLLAAPRWTLALGGLLERTAIFRAGRELLSPPAPKAILPAEVDTVLDNSAGPERYHRDDPLASAVTEHFERNLQRMTELARRAGAHILFVTPAASLRNCSPFKSEGPAERDASVWYARGEKLYAAGDYAEARRAYERALDEDVCPLRAISAIREAVRHVHAPVLDFERILAEKSEHGVPGDDWFVDHVHLSEAGYRLLGVQILEKLQQEGWADGGAPNEAQLAQAGE
ncbi:MAG: tetratricopeptide repeat protein, partial [Acidobacteria bacterium]|nr:tetratricopeptide repeat protein [Acidobacteriota bacterium]